MYSIVHDNTLIQPWREIQPTDSKRNQSKFKQALKLAYSLRMAHIANNSSARPLFVKWKKSTAAWKKKIKSGSLVRSVVSLGNSSALVCGNIVWGKVEAAVVKITAATAAAAAAAASAASSSSSSSSSSSLPTRRKKEVPKVWWPCQVQYPEDATTTTTAAAVEIYNVQPLGCDKEGIRFQSTGASRKCIKFFNTRSPDIDLMKKSHSYEGAVQGQYFCCCRCCCCCCQCCQCCQCCRGCYPYCQCWLTLFFVVLRCFFFV